MATIKAGTYRFNDVLTAYSETDWGQVNANFNFSVTGTKTLTQEELDFFNAYLVSIGMAELSVVPGTYNITIDCTRMAFVDSRDSFAYWFISYTFPTATIVPTVSEYDATVITPASSFEWYQSTGGWYIHENTNIDGQTITIPKDTEVSDEFEPWFTANTKRLSTITYNGSTIASLLGGQTATLKCAGKTMETDVVVEVAEGGGGECDQPHVIEVDELPTENIDKNAIYSCGGNLYKWANEFADVIVNNGVAVSYKDVLEQQGATFSLNTIPTKTTEGIKESDLSTVYHAYFIEDEADIFFYAYENWYSASMLGMANGGVITDISEATEMGHYYALFELWRTYAIVNGTLDITENGTFEVTTKESVSVNVPAFVMVQTIDDLSADAPNGSMAIVLNG